MRLKDSETFNAALENIRAAERLIAAEIGYHPDLHPLYWPHQHEAKHLITRTKEHIYRMLAEAEGREKVEASATSPIEGC